MALTMVHLLVAHRWAQAHPQYLDCPEFYLGIVSPDALHVRFKDDKSRKNEFHLNNWVEAHPEDVIAYWREHATPFDIGYGVHVLTDGQWVPRFKSRLPGLISPTGKLNTDAYYNDTFVTDFALYHGMSISQTLFNHLKTAIAPENHPYLTSEELDIWRKGIIELYQKPCPMNQPVQFINKDYVLSFVEDSTPLIESTYGRLFA